MEGNASGGLGNMPRDFGENVGVAADSAEKQKVDALDLEEREALRSLGERAIISSGQLVNDVKNTELGVIEDVPQGIVINAETQKSSEDLRREVAIQNYGRKNIESGASLVGMESKKEVKERLADDAEDAKIEAGMGWGNESAIMTSSQERLTRETVQKVDKIIKTEVVQPRLLERERQLGMVALLRGSFGRIFGSRN